MALSYATATSQDGDNVYKASDGTWVSDQNGLTLRSAFQPLFAVRNSTLVPVAAEGLIRVFDMSERVSTGTFLKAASGKKREEVEALTRTMHIRNAQLLHPMMRRLFINFDPSVLGSPARFETTMNEIGKELLRAKIAPGNVVCEITEQKTMDISALKNFVYLLRARGYLVAIDDFGAQSSNAERVAALTPDIVKLDGYMVQEMMATPSGFLSLKQLIDEFRQQRIQVVLEGLEKSWQLILATKTQADFFQGFALAVPRIAPARFPEWVGLSSQNGSAISQYAANATK